MKTCIEHIAPAIRPPYHDVTACRCLITQRPVLTRWRNAPDGIYPCPSRGRWQPECVAEKLNAIADDLGLKRV